LEIILRIFCSPCNLLVEVIFLVVVGVFWIFRVLGLWGHRVVFCCFFFCAVYWSWVICWQLWFLDICVIIFTLLELGFVGIFVLVLFVWFFFCVFFFFVQVVAFLFLYFWVIFVWYLIIVFVFYYVGIFVFWRLVCWRVFNWNVLFYLCWWLFITWLLFVVGWKRIVLNFIGNLNFYLGFFILFILFLWKFLWYLNIFDRFRSLCYHHLKWTSSTRWFLLNYICNRVLSLLYLRFSKFKQSSWYLNSIWKLFFNFLFLFKILRLSSLFICWINKITKNRKSFCIIFFL
jgi:hypothetical protein